MKKLFAILISFIIAVIVPQIIIVAMIILLKMPFLKLLPQWISTAIAILCLLLAILSGIKLFLILYKYFKGQLENI
jgi:hypothetical protein